MPTVEYTGGSGEDEADNVDDDDGGSSDEEDDSVAGWMSGDDGR